MNPEQPNSPLLVWLVEDNPIVHRTLTRILSSLGCHLQVVCDGASCLSLMARTGLEAVPDLVLLDLGLPDMRGETLAQEFHLNPLFRKCKLVAHTGQDLDDLGESCLTLFHDILPKPASFEALRELIHSLPIAT